MPTETPYSLCGVCPTMLLQDGKGEAWGMGSLFLGKKGLSDARKRKHCWENCFLVLPIQWKGLNVCRGMSKAMQNNLENSTDPCLLIESGQVKETRQEAFHCPKDYKLGLLSLKPVAFYCFCLLTCGWRHGNKENSASAGHRGSCQPSGIMGTWESTGEGPEVTNWWLPRGAKMYCLLHAKHCAKDFISIIFYFSQ